MGPGAVPSADSSNGEAESVGQRSTATTVAPISARPRVVQFSLTEEEFKEISGAATRADLARGAFVAEVTLAAARGAQARAGSPLCGALIELMAAAGLVRRVGTNLNQAVAGLMRLGSEVRIYSLRLSFVCG
jgi:hypothetical protein